MRFKACLAFLILLFATPAFSDNWQAPIYEYGAPAHLVGVDKKRRTFNFFEKKSPFKLRYSYPCVTGQIPGDKQQINDLRTPEGIYFVEYKIANGLDFREYGGIAYTLNYPNPVDRLRGKTGHGIWIHSKGFELAPTRGCVAIGLDNIAEVGPLLLPGTPVVLAEELKNVSDADNGTLAALRGMMNEWSAAWAAKSPRMFDFYDPDAYSRATENFTLFRQNKERLFKLLSFIKIFNREIHAIEGPGYWVTWSEQFYTASNLSTEGIRRLYWQKDDVGRFRIVGMEWTPRDVGMAAAFQTGTLVADAATTVTDASLEAPVAPRIDLPELAPEQRKVTQAVAATGKSPTGTKAADMTPDVANLGKNIATAADPLVPANKPSLKRPDEINWGSGKRLNEPKPAATPTPQAPPLHLPASPAPVTKKAPDAAILPEEIKRLAYNWQQTLQNRDAGIDIFYDARDYNRLPASMGVPKGRSLAATLQAIRRDFRQPWLIVTSNEPEITINGPIACSRTGILIATPQGLRQGIQRLWWRKNEEGKYRIVGSDFKPEALGLEANYLELVSDSIATTLEEWRKAWESGDLDDYMTFYATNANQQGRVGVSNIRRQKENLWGRVRPSRVQLHGLRVSLDGSGARADMNQFYTDSSGHADKGIKTLFLRYDGKNWLIQREDWVNLKPTADSTGKI